MSDPLGGFEDLDQPHRRGQATEAICKAAFLSRSIPVLTPEYDNESYDFVIELDGRFLRIQAKTAYSLQEGTVRFETVSTRSRSEGYDRVGYAGKIDFYAVFNPKLHEIYLIHESEAADGKMEVRCTPPKNNQRQGINWHEDYLLDQRLSGLVESLGTE